jgi:hypothetical protein
MSDISKFHKGSSTFSEPDTWKVRNTKKEDQKRAGRVWAAGATIDVDDSKEAEALMREGFEVMDSDEYRKREAQKALDEKNSEGEK